MFGFKKKDKKASPANVYADIIAAQATRGQINSVRIATVNNETADIIAATTRMVNAQRR